MGGSHRFAAVRPGDRAPEVVNTIVEIAKGRRSKFELDEETGLFRLDRYLYSSSHYPGDYGFVPQTVADDGDALDVLIMVNEPTFSGCLIAARVLGIFGMTDRGKGDDKVLAVPDSDPLFADYQSLGDVPPHFLREVEHFFTTYKQLEGAHVEARGWLPREAACEAVVRAIEGYRRR
jgi:inorganic pyrophosphatase